MRPSSAPLQIPALPFLLPGIVALMACKEANPLEDTGLSDDTQVASTGPDFVKVSEDSSLLQTWNYRVEEWQLGLEAASPYDSLYADEVGSDGLRIDYRPTFLVLRGTEAEFNPEAALLWLHGGGVADDRDFSETGELPQACQPDKILRLVNGPVNKKPLPIIAALDAGWTVIFPRNDWCDAWLGQGPLDPNNPTKFGNHHLHRILDFAGADGLGFSWPERQFLWGSSAGGVGAMFFASMRDDIESIVVDSSPTDWVAYYDDDPEVVESHFGGPPFEDDGSESPHYPDYLRASGPYIISENLLSARLFLAWNSLDLLIPPVHGSRLVQALETAPSRLPTDFGHKDFSRQYPDPNFHVQVSHPVMFPAATAQVAMTHFLLGRELNWLEAEKDCLADQPCTAGVLFQAQEESTEQDRAMSGRSGRRGDEGTEEGVLWSGEWLSSTAEPQDVHILFAASFHTGSQLEPDAVVARIEVKTLNETVQQEVLAEDLHLSYSHNPGAMLRQVQATSLHLQDLTEYPLQISWRHTGLTRTLLDHVIVSSAPH